MTYLYFKGRQIGEYKRDRSGLVLVANDIDCFGTLLRLEDSDRLKVGKCGMTFPTFVRDYVSRTAAFYTSPESYRQMQKSHQ